MGLFINIFLCTYVYIICIKIYSVCNVWVYVYELSNIYARRKGNYLQNLSKCQNIRSNIDTYIV